MLDVKLTTCAPTWPWARQTPEERLEWGPFRFHVDAPIERCDAWVVFESLSVPEETVCAPENVLFIAGEPDSIGFYQPAFLRQFFYVISGRNNLQHERQIQVQQGHPWFVEKSFDELLKMPPITKTRDISVISSDKAFTDGHRARLEFINKLKSRFGDRVDFWGRGIRDFENKWDVLAPYRYAVVLENCADRDFLTEKLPDALLAYCYPIYYGCDNVKRYLPDDACLRISIDDPDAALASIEHILAMPDDYANRLESISRARLYYLHHLQFFANMSNILQVTLAERRPPEVVRLLPNSAFPVVRALTPGHPTDSLREPKFAAKMFSHLYTKLRSCLDK
jgi:hypothetical protein